MSIEIALVIAGISLIFSVCQVISNIRRGQKSDDRQEATQLTTVIVKLETISTGISEIKSDIRNVKDEVKDMRERLIKVEESTKQAHHRIDELVRKEQGGEEHE